MTLYLTMDFVKPVLAPCVAKGDHLRSQYSATNHSLWSVYTHD